MGATSESMSMTILLFNHYCDVWHWKAVPVSVTLLRRRRNFIQQYNTIFLFIQFIVHCVLLGNYRKAVCRLPAIHRCKLYISENNIDKWCVDIKKIIYSTKRIASIIASRPISAQLCIF